MSAIFQFVVRHGYVILFGALFVHQIGFPVPGPLFLLSAGALSGAGKLNIPVIVALTIVACVLADWIWYEAGRLKGDRALHLIHRFTKDPQEHNRRAKETFARYGLGLLLVAKFVPGLDAVAPPLAGTSRTSRFRFLAFDAAGAGLYAFAYSELGYLFRHDLNRAANYVSRAGTFFASLLLASILIYTASRLIRRFWFVRGASNVHIAPPHLTELETLLTTESGITEGERNGK